MRYFDYIERKKPKATDNNEAQALKIRRYIFGHIQNLVLVLAD